jgi:hypothetical protein
VSIDKRVCRKTQGAAEPGNTCLTTPGTCESCPDWSKQLPTEMLSLRKINEKLDALLEAKEDTVRFRELLLERLTGIHQAIAQNSGVSASELAYVRLGIGNLQAEVEQQNIKLAAVFAKLCAQQEARRVRRAPRKTR